MIRNYLTIALRSMMRNKAYTIINIFGLSAGVVCCLLLMDYIDDEANFTKRQSNINNTPYAPAIMADEHEHSLTAPAPIARRIKDEVPEAVHTPRNTSAADDQLVRYDDKPLVESESPVADTTLFDIITYHSRSRNPKKALV
ncbi:hypothetical protein KK083_22975 [Fulvivirgaceae bacterium PWU4]|uniref:ABC transporter permease n=1 Tax=Chryseosolibacter histidini TaxID=2782349 RepID=A0AAP2DQM5_9BACT|nr:hypothetical protein [Chryseosolibacter histidini]MBT1699769.1 hypothetical protein [Chryseosolibacter histidini]